MADLTQEQIDAQKATQKKEGKFVSLQEIYDGYAKKATKEKDFEVDIVKTYEVEFTKDFLNIAKGHKQKVSKVMLDWYDANGAIKVIKED